VAKRKRALEKITIAIAADTVAKARAQAAKRGMSLARYIAEVLDERLRHDDAYERAMRSYLSRGPYKELTGPPVRYPTREALHDRAALRREHNKR